MATPPYLKPVPDWQEHEKPSMPGSPSMPWHPPWRRVAYALVAILVGITGALGNGLVSANLPVLQGQLGLTPSEGAWISAAYVMVNVTANLLVFKCRQQFGMRWFAEVGLGIYAALTLLHLAVGTLATTLIVRAASGLAGAACSTLCLLYMLQSMPRTHTGKMLVIGVGIGQLAAPLAWVVSPALLDQGGGSWHNLYLFEAGLALCSFAAVVVLKLPPGIQIKVFEPLDFLTFALMAPAVAMVCAVLVQGYLHWWFDARWLGWLLIAALLLILAAVFLEHHRANPLIQTRWFANGATVRFVIGGVILRFLTAEQSVGAVSFLRAQGMGPDQLQPLFAVILAGMVLGILACSISFTPKTLVPQILLSIVLFAVAGLMDHHRTSLDRPQDFYLSQFLLSIGAGMFMGPLMLIGIGQALKNGPAYMVTFSVMFSITQTMGGLVGSAVLNTYQLYREHEFSASLVATMDRTDPVVATRLAQQAAALGAVIGDPVLRSAQGTAQLAAVARRESNVRAYNDVFMFSAVTAIAFLLWLLALLGRTALTKRLAERRAADLPAGAPAHPPPARP
ncbi:MFS transporter [Mitsuaria sp. GD03876]|uniref:MFS transporter n=1 Tax=Mitsuaria sp. GD03876 TaxID=2975399 RepID=UPI0024476281|nr:MFS transporter [Mitsuaria sp. GD03876]MDH0864984.1 MFS transporter [Mitsuaria sp. GD03876]